MRSKLALVVWIALLVASCKTNEQACAELFIPGTDSYGNCVMQREQMAFEANQRNAEILRQNAIQQQQNLNNQLNAMRSISQQQPYPTGTSCYRAGNMVYCN